MPASGGKGSWTLFLAVNTRSAIPVWQAFEKAYVAYEARAERGN